MISLADFERLVEETAGLDADSIGTSTVERAVRERIQASGARNVEEYWTHVSQIETELQALIEAVVVPETWFFRDIAAFTALQRVAQGEWSCDKPDHVMQLLSIPCSTGEEPYSIAMALLDAGLPPTRFHICAVDISQRALAHARRGVYGGGAFRGKELSFRDRYFTSTPRGHLVSEQVRNQVQFEQGNLFAQSFVPGHELFDVIFCATC